MDVVLTGDSSVDVGAQMVPAVLAGWTAFYATFGIAKLGVLLDLGLIAATFGLVVLAVGTAITGRSTSPPMLLPHRRMRCRRRQEPNFPRPANWCGGSSASRTEALCTHVMWVARGPHRSGRTQPARKPVS